MCCDDELRRDILRMHCNAGASVYLCSMYLRHKPATQATQASKQHACHTICLPVVCCAVLCGAVQVGYPIIGPKRAIVSAWLGSSTAVTPYIQTTLRLPAGPASPFSVVDAVTGGEVFTGTAKMFGDGVVHEYFKQVAYHLDFSALTTPVGVLPWASLIDDLSSLIGRSRGHMDVAEA